MIIQLKCLGRRKTGSFREPPARGAKPRTRWAGRVRFQPALEGMEERALLSTLTVTSASDSGPDSLRAAIAGASSGDTIDFARTLYGQTIVLHGGELAIDQSLNIEGPGAPLLAISGNGGSRVFDVTTSGVNVTISGLTIEDGLAVQGGGILDEGGSLVLEYDVIAGNQAVGTSPEDFAEGGAAGAGENAGDGGATLGGGIAIDGGTFMTTVASSTVDGNSAVGGIGGNSTASSPGNGGIAQGGGIGITGVSASSPNLLDVSGSSIAFNVVTGGIGGAGGNGGDGQGGGLYVDALSILSIDTSTVTTNFAFGGAGGLGTTTGASGQGQGGGVYLAGTGSTESHTWIFNNVASTSNSVS